MTDNTRSASRSLPSKQAVRVAQAIEDNRGLYMEEHVHLLSREILRLAKAAPVSESADALDAARYRWLREKVGATTGFQLEVARVKPWSLEPWSGGQLDLAVDTAIEKSRQAERQEFPSTGQVNSSKGDELDKQR